MKISIVNNSGNNTKCVIANNAEMATSFIPRFRGLMFRSSFGEFNAMYLSPCSSIHTYFMKFPIDILCLDKNKTIVDMAASISPGKIYIPSKKTYSVIELPHGSIKHFKISISNGLEFAGQLC